MKLCRYCNKYYPESEFGVALTTPKKVYRRRKCKSCYHATKQRLRKKYNQWLIDYKKKNKCSKCGTNDYRVLEFHHPKNKDKEFNIGDAFKNGYGLGRIEKELKKCIIVCANCHKVMHYKDRGRNIK